MFYMPRLVLLAGLSRLTESQVKVLIDIGVAAGQLTGATMVLPFLVPGLDKAKLPVIVWGIMITALFWVGSVLLAKKIKL